MVSLVSELTSYRWRNAWLRGNIRSLDPSIVFIVGMIFIRALLICCLSVTNVRIFSLCKSAMVVVVVILSIFVRNFNPFLLILFFLRALRKPASQLGYILESETVGNHTFLVIMSIEIVNWKSLPTDLNLITSWELGVIAKYCQCEVLFAVANTCESDPKRGRTTDIVFQTWFKENRRYIYAIVWAFNENSLVSLNFWVISNNILEC